MFTGGENKSENKVFYDHEWKKFVNVGIKIKNDYMTE